MLGSFRSQFNPLKRWLAEPLARTGISPLAISLAGIPLSMVAGAFLLSGHTFLAVLWGGLAALTDFLDGAVARAQGRESPVGNYLEAMADRIVESVLLLSLAQLYPLPAAFALTFSLIVSYAKPRVALVLVTDNRDWPGWADHADRVLIILLTMALTDLPGTPFGQPWPALLLWGLASVSLVGAVQRVTYAVKLIKEAEQEGTLLPYLTVRHGTSGRTPPPEQ